jgi:gluconolactonase
MKTKALVVIALCLLGSTFALAQEDGAPASGGGRGGRGGQNLPPPAKETVAPDIPGVVAGGTKVQLVKEGLQDAQGATAGPDGSLLFAERGANRIAKVDKDGTLSTYMENTSQTNTFVFDPKGRVIGAQWTPARVAVLGPTRTVLADKFEGHEFGQPKDLIADKKGGVYFTDQRGVFAEGVGPGVYYIKPNGGTIKLASDIPRPSGVMLSVDEKTLYVTDSLGTFIKQADVQADGSIRNERNFAEMFPRMPAHSMADGMAIDATGRLYVASYKGVLVFSPQGKQLGTIPIPRQPINLAFAGPDKKTLYVLGVVFGYREETDLFNFNEDGVKHEFGALYQIPMLAEGYKGRAK